MVKDRNKILQEFLELKTKTINGCRYFDSANGVLFEEDSFEKYKDDCPSTDLYSDCSHKCKYRYDKEIIIDFLEDSNFLKLLETVQKAGITILLETVEAPELERTILNRYSQITLTVSGKKFYIQGTPNGSFDIKASLRNILVLVFENAKTAPELLLLKNLCQNRLWNYEGDD